MHGIWRHACCEQKIDIVLPKTIRLTQASMPIVQHQEHVVRRIQHKTILSKTTV